MNEPLDPDMRDEALASQLEVAPVDEVTRRRLVRTALERPAAAPSTRWMTAVSVAAALAIGAFVGVVLVDEQAPPESTTAQRAPTASDVEALESVPAAGADAASGPVTLLGDLGDVTRLADLRAAIDVSFERAAGPMENAVAAYGCGDQPPGNFGLVATSAAGTGTYEGAPVTVFIGTTPEGQALAVIVRAGDCTAVANVSLDPR